MAPALVIFGRRSTRRDESTESCSDAGCNVVNPQDSANLLAFLKVLRKTIGTSKLITAAVSTGGFLEPDGAPLPSFAEFGAYFDYINLMAVRPLSQSAPSKVCS